MKRRKFLIQTGLAAAGGVVAGSWAGCASPHAPVSFNNNAQNGGGNIVAIIADPADPVVAAPPAQWGVDQLRRALVQRGFDVHLVASVADASPGARCIVAAGGTSPLARDAGAATPTEAESLAITPGRLGTREVLVASGADARGLMYALTEIADAITLADVRVALYPGQAIVERPANAVRSVMRMFVSDVEDKQWYNDRNFWLNYLSMLAAQRFNRFNLAFGLGYDAPSGLRDTYLYFAYPFLLDVPGYNVNAVGLPNGERDNNLAMLRFISDEAAARGLDFQLGLWTHAYAWTNSPKANYNISGLTPQTQAPYSRDALAIILKECPGITGVTFRIHGESGVPEGSYDLWRTIFDGCVRSGRRIEIDMHAKGMDQPTIDAALGTGLPVTISPKFSAEHMGLPYHQAAIRPTEMPTKTRGGGAFAESGGARSFLRYSYGDLLTEDRKYGIFHRIWPGTQRLFLWGDPVFAAGYSRAGSFCGSLGQEIFDPLSFKGRKGSGLPGGRDGYADLTMRAPGGDFEKYRYGFRVWGRLLYNPDTPAECWQRQLEREFASAAGAVEASLAHASRILPLVTTAHLPSAANANYWPEMYTDMSIIDSSGSKEYTDTPSPKRFGTTSPLDPQLFSRMEDYADELLQGPPSARYSPIEVAQWLEDLAASADDYFGRAREREPDRRLAAYRRYAADVAAQIALGRFFGKKIRAGVLYALHERTGDPAALAAALKVFREARELWRVLSNTLTGVYVPDLTFGDTPWLRGHWSDRLEAMDNEINILDERASNVLTAATNPQYIPVLIEAVQGAPLPRPAPGLGHLPPALFRRGEPVVLDLIPLQDATPLPVAQLHYRQTQQAEAWQTLPMTRVGDGFRAEIPGEYTNSPYALSYYFELRDPTGGVAIYPGFNSTLANQPYFVLRQLV